MKIKQLYTWGLSLFFILLASPVVQAGVEIKDLNPEGRVRVLPAILMIAILILFICVGIFSKAKGTEDYWAAGRGIGQIGGGMAIASNWMSAASYLGMAGLIYLKGYYALSYVLGWTGGYVVLLVMCAAQIRRYGKYTAPDFVGDRYYSQTARLVSALTVICICFVYAVGQYKGIAMMFNWIFGINYETSVIVGTMVILAYVLISGMLGATKNMMVQYVIIVITFLLPLFFIAGKLDFFSAIPQIGYGAGLWDIGHEGGRISAQFAEASFIQPFANAGPYRWFALAITLMLGTAGLPHVLNRFYLTPKVSDARWQVVWGLFFIALVYWTAPAYAAFAKFAELGREAGFLEISTTIDPDAIVVNAAELAGLPEWFAGFLAAGGVSAAFSTTGGLLITGASAFSHDLYFRYFNPQATEERKIFVARISTVVLGVAIIIIAMNPPAFIAQITAVAFALAANTFFPLFLLGLWWSRTTREAGLAGLFTGLIVTFGSMFIPQGSVLATLVPYTCSAILGVPLVIIVMIVVSKMTPEPKQEIKELLYRVHNDE